MSQLFKGPCQELFALAVILLTALAVLSIWSGQTKPALAAAPCQAASEKELEGKKRVTKIRGSKLKLYSKPNKGADPEVYKKKEVKSCLPFPILDESVSGLLEIQFNGSTTKWVEAHKVKVGDKKVKVNCLQVSQNTGSSRGAGESACD